MTVRYLPFTLRLRAPAILNVAGGDPNSAATLGFIPGAAIRGALAARLGDPDRRVETRSLFDALVLDGSVRCLNAYPLDDAKRRTLPSPVSLRSPKEEGDQHLDLAAFEGQSQEDWPDASLSACRWQFVSLTSAQPSGINAGIGARTHHQRDRKRGRAWKEICDGREITHGAIFTYESLDPGQEFGGFIQVCGSDEVDCQSRIASVQRLLKKQIHLGRSRRAGYGGAAEIVWGTVTEREVSGEGVISEDLETGNLFRVFFTSDCIVRDSRSGQLDPAALPAVLLARLDNRASLQGIRWAFSVTGGFNRKWRLELPQARTVAAGSVFLFRAEDRLPIADLLAIENEGVGERVTEGYGRFTFLKAPVQRLRILHRSKAQVQQPPSPAPEMVTLIERRLLQSALSREIETLALTIASRASRVPTPSLLGRLRGPLRAQPAGALQTLAQWLGSGDGALRRPAQDQLNRCRIVPGAESLSLATWIRELVGDNRWGRLRDWLRLEALAQRNHVASEKASLNLLEERKDEIAVRLIDAVLAALAKLRKRKEGEGK